MLQNHYRNTVMKERTDTICDSGAGKRALCRRYDPAFRGKKFYTLKKDMYNIVLSSRRRRWRR